MVTLSTINSAGRFQECTFSDKGREIFPSGSSKNGWRTKGKNRQWKDRGTWWRNKERRKLHILQHCAVYVADGSKWIYTADLQHCNSCSSFLLQLLYSSPISPCWCLPHSTQAKWGISMHIRGSLTRRPKQRLLWNYDKHLIVSFVPLNCQYLAAKLARSVNSQIPVYPSILKHHRQTAFWLMLITLFWLSVAS